MAAVDYFLEIDGIVGESMDAHHKGAIDLDSFEWAESNLGTHPAGSGGAGVGKVAMQDLRVVTKTSKASPLLLLAVATGQHFKQAVLTVRKAGKNQAEFLVFRLSDVLVSTYEIAGHTEAVPADQVSFNFAKIEVEYRPQKPDGSLAAAVKAGWDVKANKKA
jgi:type VI secretion system secreted protein Hcp